MLGELGAHHLQEWTEYGETEPWGLERGEMAAAYAFAALAAQLTGRAQRPKDFLIPWEAKPQDWEAMRATLDVAMRVQANADDRPD